MRATTLLRTVASLAALALVGGCGDDPVGLTSFSEREKPLESMTIIPASVTITAGRVVFLKAKLTSRSGDVFEPAGVTWKSSSDAIAVVSTHGEVLGTREGQAVITATVAGTSQSATVRVLPGKQGKELKPHIEERPI